MIRLSWDSSAPRRLFRKDEDRRRGARRRRTTRRYPAPSHRRHDRFTRYSTESKMAPAGDASLTPPGDATA